MCSFNQAPSPCFIMNSVSRKASVAAWRIAIMLLFASLIFPSTATSCHIPAIYNFGDSNSDTGSVSAAFGRVPPPQGETFFGKPSGRYSDGRLIIDFIADKVGLPFLSAYLDSIERNFTHGSNFAVSGATVQQADGKIFDAGFNPLSLHTQLQQFQGFKERCKELYDQDRCSWIKSTLPRPENFGKALYTLDCGQNDLHYFLISYGPEQALRFIPNVINQFALAIMVLYEEGARSLWIHNTGPIGCLPFFLEKRLPKIGEEDKHGCILSHNKVAQEFNKQLKDKILELRDQLFGVQLVYVDMYSAKYELISDADRYGFINPTGYCCGQPEFLVDYGKTAIVNGSKIRVVACSDPSKYISWDGIHYTDAAAKWVANRIADGSLSDPPVPVTGMCQQKSVSSY